MLLLGRVVYAETPAASQLIQRYHPSRRSNTHEDHELQDLYIWTLKYSLTGVLLHTPAYLPALTLGEPLPFDERRREAGLDFPQFGLTMVGVQRLDNLHLLITSLLNKGVEGDLVECGVWRGGSSIFMRGVLKAYNVKDRTVHLVDSFEGLPRASTTEDHNAWEKMDILKVPQQDVEDAFKRYNLLDDQVQFHKGYFRHSLPKFRASHKNGRLALLRMDGDMYESTMDILFNLADLLAPEACIVVDDWIIPECQKAIKEFLTMHNLDPKIIPTDATGVYFCLDEKVVLKHHWYDNFNLQRSA